MADFFAGESFAVVDLETTGTRKEEGDRIIQFGCAIVKDGEVVKTYSFMMNPHRKIPLAVTNLTGIDQKMVAARLISSTMPRRSARSCRIRFSWPITSISTFLS